MILESAYPEYVASVDVPTGYPSPEHTKHIGDIIEFVENSLHQVEPCSAYYYMKETFDKGNVACRAGYHFRFWFARLESAKEFARIAQGKLEVPAVGVKPKTHHELPKITQQELANGIPDLQVAVVNESGRITSIIGNNEAKFLPDPEPDPLID